MILDKHISLLDIGYYTRHFGMGAIAHRLHLCNGGYLLCYFRVQVNCRYQ